MCCNSSWPQQLNIWYCAWQQVNIALAFQKLCRVVRSRAVASWPVFIPASFLHKWFYCVSNKGWSSVSIDNKLFNLWFQIVLFFRMTRMLFRCYGEDMGEAFPFTVFWYTQTWWLSYKFKFRDVFAYILALLPYQILNVTTKNTANMVLSTLRNGLTMRISWAGFDYKQRKTIAIPVDSSSELCLHS